MIYNDLDVWVAMQHDVVSVTDLMADIECLQDGAKILQRSVRFAITADCSPLAR